MQPTKYPVKPVLRHLHAISSRGDDAIDQKGADVPGDGSRREPPGRVAPLDLIEEHLTVEIPESRFRQAIHGNQLIKNWSFEEGYKPSADGDQAICLKVQEFKAGGFEATCRRLDLEKIGRAIDFGGRRGKREPKDEISIVNVEKSGQRAKREVRYKIKNMGATNLLTLTKQEGPNTKGWTDSQWLAWQSGGKAAWIKENGAFWTPDRWAKAWDKARRMIEKATGCSFPYVAILEQHRKGNYHIHLAWVGKVNLNLLWPIWRTCTGGKGKGGVDSKHIKCPSGCNRSAIIARYISKYVSKVFEEEGEYRFNKKRYWSSRQDIPAARRYVLKESTFHEVLTSLMPWMNFQFDDRHNFFPFPGGTSGDIGGFWWNYIPEMHDPGIPF